MPSQKQKQPPSFGFTLPNERPTGFVDSDADDHAAEDEERSQDSPDQQGGRPPSAGPASNEVTFDTLVITSGRGGTDGKVSAYATRVGGADGMSDFPSGLLGVSAPGLQLNLDKLTRGRQDRIIYQPDAQRSQHADAEQEQPSSAGPQGSGSSSSSSSAAAYPDHVPGAAADSTTRGSSSDSRQPAGVVPTQPPAGAAVLTERPPWQQAAGASSSPSWVAEGAAAADPDQHQSLAAEVEDGPSHSAQQHPTDAAAPRRPSLAEVLKQQQSYQPTAAAGPQQHQQQQRPAGPSQPRPHPFYLRPQHIKTNYKCPTGDGWRLHLVRTRQLVPSATRFHPVILCPGLGSSGAYTFDLSPNVSLADYLASNGWDVWTVELRGNGQSDKPGLFSGHSRWWTIDDHVEKDVPALIRYVTKQTNSTQVHFLGHSMGGMVLCGVMARVDTTTARIRSCITVGSGLFLEDSWWRLFERLTPLAGALWTVPSGAMLRWYSKVMFGPYAIPYLDNLYFWPSNVDPRVGRAMMSRNFSNISVGVVKQMTTAFSPQGLTSADGRMVYADARRLSKVSAPSLFLVGDRDRMCPAEGCRRTWQMFGSPNKRFVCLGPAAGFSSHYGHFDILIGKKVDTEVFPLIQQFLEQHDLPLSRL